MADRAGESTIEEETDYDEHRSYRDHAMPLLQGNRPPTIHAIPARADSVKPSSLQQIDDEFSSRTASSSHTDKFATPPRTSRSSTGELHASPSREQVNGFINEVLLVLSDAMVAFPKAFGLVVTFTNKICLLADAEFFNIENSGETITFAFSRLGYAYCNFPECNKAKCVAVFQALSRNINIPSTYKMLFTYFAGHGMKEYIGLKDGYLPISTIKELFESAAPQIRSIPKVLFLDRCRQNLTKPADIILPSVENLLIINCTRFDHRAYLITNEGIGVGTAEFVEVLFQNRKYSFHEMVAQFIFAVKNRYREIAHMSAVDYPVDDYASLWPDYEGSLDHYPNLYQDMIDGMSPSGEMLDEATLMLTFQYPLHSDRNGFQHFFIESKSQHSTNWEKEVPELNSPEHQFSEDQLRGKRFRVGATYEMFGETTSSTIVFFKLGDIKPHRVQVNRIERTEAEISWAESENMYLFRNCSCTILVGRKRFNSDSNSEWEVIKIFQGSGNSSYRVSAHEAVDHSYAVRYCVDDRLSEWEIADRLCLDQQQYNYFTSVTMTRTGNESFIEWNLSPHFHHREENDAYIEIKRRNSSSDPWIDVRSDISVDDSRYPVQSDWLEDEFMVGLFFQGDGEPWLSETKFVSFKEPDPGIHIDPPNRCSWRICPIIFYIMLCFMVYMSSIISSTHYTYGFHGQSEIRLAIASDVIDCKDRSDFLHYLYDMVSVTEASDSNKMDNQFIGVEVFSIPYSNISYRIFNPEPWSDTINYKPGSKTNKHFLPPGGFNRPWYLRNRSKVNVTVNKIQVDDLPQKITLFLFSNEESVNEYLSDPDSNPRYASKIEIPLSHGEYIISINDSAYYYIMVDFQSDYDITFTYTVTFNIFYIDIDDYKDVYKKKIGSNGSTVSERLDLHNKNITLCWILPISSSLESHSTHLQIEYSTRAYAITVMALILLTELAIMAFFICPIWKLTAYCFKKSSSHIGYEIMTDMTRSS